MEILDKSDAVQIWVVLETREYVESWRVSWKKSFLPFKETHFLESLNSQIFEQTSWSLFSKCGKFHVDLKNAIKSSEIVFGF